MSKKHKPGKDKVPEIIKKYLEINIPRCEYITEDSLIIHTVWHNCKTMKTSLST